MKFNLRFFAFISSLICVARSTAVSDSSATSLPTPSVCDVLRAYQKVLIHPFNYQNFNNFHSALVSYIPQFVLRDNCSLDEKLIPYAKYFKYFYIIEQIKKNYEASKPRPHAIVIKSKWKLFLNLYQVITKYFSERGYTTDQIKIIYQKFIHFLDWEGVSIYSSNLKTIDHWKSCVEEVAKNLPTAPCLQVLRAIIYFRAQNTENLNNNSSINPTNFVSGTDYSPAVNIEFANLSEIICFFLDYMSVIRKHHPKFTLEFVPDGTMIIKCPYCLTSHTTIYSQTECKLQNDLRHFLFSLHDNVKLEGERLLNQYTERMKSGINLKEKLNILKHITQLPTEQVNHSIQGITFSAYPNESNEFMRQLLTQYFCSIPVFAQFHNSLASLQSFYSFLLKERFEEIRHIQTVNLKPFHPKTDYFRRFIDSIENANGKTQAIYCLKELLGNGTKLFMTYKFIYKTHRKFKHHLVRLSEDERKGKRQKLDTECDKKICIVCQEEENDVNDPFVHPICSCDWWNIHVSCYATQMLKESFRCGRCDKSLVELTCLQNYLDDFNNSVIDEITFEPFYREGVNVEQPSNTTGNASHDTPSSSKVMKDVCEEITSLSKITKSLMMKIASCCFLEDEESLPDFFAIFTDDVSEFIRVITSDYGAILECMEIYMRESVLARSEDSSEIWEEFLVDCWNPIKELDENDYYETF